jgi:hypothetical protein
MSKADEHPIIAIHVAGEKTRVECECGWKSKSAKSETDARREHDQHLKKAR